MATDVTRVQGEVVNNPFDEDKDVVLLLNHFLDALLKEQNLVQNEVRL